MDTEAFRYQKFISDIAGQGVSAHDDAPKNAVTAVRDWLRVESGRTDIPDGQIIWRRFSQFQRELPRICGALELNPRILKLKFVDYQHVIYHWLRKYAPGRRHRSLMSWKLLPS